LSYIFHTRCPAMQSKSIIYSRMKNSDTCGAPCIYSISYNIHTTSIAIYVTSMNMVWSVGIAKLSYYLLLICAFANNAVRIMTILKSARYLSKYPSRHFDPVFNNYPQVFFNYTIIRNKIFAPCFYVSLRYVSLRWIRCRRI
jgi:hypothetical protein